MSLPDSNDDPRPRWQLLWRGNTIELPRQGALVVGRSPRCDVVIAHTQVSRTHCRLHVVGGAVTVEDLASANGLYVNGERVVAVRALADGDRLLLGTEELVVCSGGQEASAKVRREHMLTPERPMEHAVDIPAAWRRHTPGADQRIVTTRKTDAFATLGKLADRMLASGRHEAAAKILSGHMKSVLAGVREGREMPEEVIAGSIQYALKLASSRSEASWLDYVIDLHLALRRTLSQEVFDQLRLMMQRGVAVDWELLSRYKQVVRAAALDGSGTDRAVAEAILALSPGPDRR
jgi:hypothetical protein